VARDALTTTSRLATDDDVSAWQQHGYVLLDSLIGTEEIDAAAEALWGIYPRPEGYHADAEVRAAFSAGRSDWKMPTADEGAGAPDGFVYLSDVDEASRPTSVVSRQVSGDTALRGQGYSPEEAPHLYAGESAEVGPRGSVFAYCAPNVFHRGSDLTAPGGARFTLGVAILSL
jgi:hypothetical protein